MEKIEELVWLHTPKTIYNMPLVLDHYNILAGKINEILDNTLSTEYDESTTPINYIRVCTQAVYNTLNSTNYAQYNNTLFFIVE